MYFQRIYEKDLIYRSQKTSQQWPQDECHKEPKKELQASLGHSVKWKNLISSKKGWKRRISAREDIKESM